MTTSKGPARLKLGINGRTAEKVIEFNYFRVNITSSGYRVKNNKTQIQKATRVAGCLYDLVWRNKYM
jgi:hypothetical protein